MSILVLGAGGQVGRAVLQRAGEGAVGLDRRACDVTDAAAVAAAVAAHRPRLVVNAAGYTAVDGAERDAAAAYRVNRDGAGIVATAAARRGVPVLHFSSDYVFDGEKRGAYVEGDRPAPASVYGASKAAGDAAVALANPRHIVLRVSWVFAPAGANFVRTMLRLGAERDEVRVVDDQRGGPTAADDVAAAVLHIACALDQGFAGWGVYNLAGAPATTWYGFARAIFDRCHGRTPRLVPIATADYPTPARRPANSVLDGGKLRAALGLGKPDWRPALDRTLARMDGGRA